MTCLVRLFGQRLSAESSAKELLGNLTEALFFKPIFDSSQENRGLYSLISTFLYPQ